MALTWTEDLHPRDHDGKFRRGVVGNLGDAIKAAADAGESRYIRKDDDGHTRITADAPEGPHYRVSPAGSVLQVGPDGRPRPVPAGARATVERHLGGTEPSTHATEAAHTPPSFEGLDGVTESRRQAYRDAADVIAHVHSTEGLPPLAAADMPDRYSYQGMFAPASTYGRDVVYAGQSDDLGGTLVHEMGHAIDWTSLSSGRGYATEGTERTKVTAALVQFGGTAKRSDALKAIDAHPARGLDKYKTYLQTDRETWARAYHQYVVTKAGTPGMRAALAKQQKRDAADNGLLPEQWSDDDFVPVGAAVERVLQAKGWMP